MILYLKSLVSYWKMSFLTSPKSFDIIKALLFKNTSEKKLAKPWIKRSSDRPYWFSRSRFAILSIAKWLEANNRGKPILIWVPDYFCNQTLDLLRIDNFSIHFYPINNDLKPNWSICEQEAIENKPDIFILVHFFGFESEIIDSRKFCDKYASVLVEDAAHVLVPTKLIGTISDFVLYSQYKFFPIPDGALMIQREPPKSSFLKKKKQPVEVMEIIRSEFSKEVNHQFQWIVKKMILKLFPDLNWVRKKSKVLHQSNQEPAFQSIISKNLLSIYMQNLSQIIKLRKDFGKTFNSIASCNNYQTLYDESSIPYLIGIKYSSNQNKIKKFHQLVLNVMMKRWPDLPPEVTENEEKFKVSNQLEKMFTFLPLHHQLDYNIIKVVSSPLRGKIEKYKVDWIRDEKKWNNMIQKNVKTNLLQTWSYGETKQELEGWIPRRALLKTDNEEVAIFQVLEKSYGFFSINRINRGPLFLNEKIDYFKKIEVFKEIRKYFSLKKRKVLFFAPYLSNSYENISVLKSANFIKRNNKGLRSYKIDLRKSKDELRSSLNGKWRNQLKKAESLGLSFQSSNSIESLKTIIKMYKGLMVKKSFKGPSPELFQILYNKNKNVIFIGRVFIDDKLIASNLISLHGASGTYEIGWNSDEGRRCYANNFLLWNTIIELKNKGFLSFDLGGFDKINNPGIAKFKKGLSGIEYNLIGEWF